MGALRAAKATQGSQKQASARHLSCQLTATAIFATGVLIMVGLFSVALDHKPHRALGIGHLGRNQPGAILDFFKGMFFMSFKAMVEGPFELDGCETFSSGKLGGGAGMNACKPEEVSMGSDFNGKNGRDGYLRLGSQGLGSDGSYPRSFMSSSGRLSIKLGQDLVDDCRAAMYPAELRSLSLLLSGATGSGKSLLAMSVAAQLGEKGVPILVLDSNRGMNDLPIEFTTTVYSGEEGAIHGVNPFVFQDDNFGGRGVKGHAIEMAQMVQRACGNKMGHQQIDLITQTIEGMYGASREQASGETAKPSFQLLIDILSELLVDPESKHEHRRISSCIRAVRSCFMHPVFGAKEPFHVEKYLSGRHRIVMDDLPDMVNKLVVESILYLVWNHLRRLEPMTKPPANDADRYSLVIVMDELHRLGLAGLRDGAVGHTLSRIVSEGRKHRLGVILASQCLDHFGTEIQSNASAQIALHVADLREARKLGNRIPVSPIGFMSLGLSLDGWYWNGVVAKRVKFKPTVGNLQSGAI